MILKKKVKIVTKPSGSLRDRWERGRNSKTSCRVHLKRQRQICCVCARVKAEKNKTLFNLCYMFNMECPNKMLLYFHLIMYPA